MTGRNGEYIPTKDQCWFRTCTLKAVVVVSIKGQEHKVCKLHGRTFGTSAERKLQS